jgi:hypothetical protein
LHAALPWEGRDARVKKPARGRGELGLSGWEDRATRLKNDGRASPGEEAARVKKPNAALRA